MQTEMTPLCRKSAVRSSCVCVWVCLSRPTTAVRIFRVSSTQAAGGLTSLSVGYRWENTETEVGSDAMVVVFHRFPSNMTFVVCVVQEPLVSIHILCAAFGWRRCLTCFHFSKWSRRQTLEQKFPSHGSQVSGSFLFTHWSFSSLPISLPPSKLLIQRISIKLFSRAHQKKPKNLKPTLWLTQKVLTKCMQMEYNEIIKLSVAHTFSLSTDGEFCFLIW